MAMSKGKKQDAAKKRKEAQFLRRCNGYFINSSKKIANVDPDMVYVKPTGLLKQELERIAAEEQNKNG
jgi:hypothetical protein